MYLYITVKMYIMFRVFYNKMLVNYSFIGECSSNPCKTDIIYSESYIKQTPYYY